MNTTRPLTLLAVAFAAAASATGAFAPGGAAYTKRVETALLSEPRILAEPTARIGYAHTLKVQEVRGAWVRVSEGAKSGWVFAGNLAETKPSETRGLDGLPLAASATSATAAARPLAPAARDYAGRHGKPDAAADLQWLTEQTAALTPADVQAFLQAQRKGEYQ
ncbi:MAG TPA: hypothetical protein VGD81_02830 [Opitutaceae bacterium]